jgi:hypothetical protein
VTNTHIAGELQHVPLVENVANQAVTFSDTKPALAVGDDAGSILATML